MGIFLLGIDNRGEDVLSIVHLLVIIGGIDRVGNWILSRKRGRRVLCLRRHSRRNDSSTMELKEADCIIRIHGWRRRRGRRKKSRSRLRS